MTTAHQTRKARVEAERVFKAEEREAARPERSHVYPVASHTKTLGDGLTRFGRPGQCPACGSFRADGKPPTIHRTDCTMGPDGSALPALNSVPDRKIPGRVPPAQRSRTVRR